MIYCPEFIVSYFLLCFILFLISLFGSQLIFLLLIFSSSRSHGRLYREIIDENGPKEITTQDNSFSKFLGPKEAVNEAFEELSEGGDMDKGRRTAPQQQFKFVMARGSCLSSEERLRICKSDTRCYCDPPNECNICKC